MLGFVRTDKVKDSGEFGRINDPVSCQAWLDTLSPIDVHYQTIGDFLHVLLTGPAHANLTVQHKLPMVETVRNRIMNLLQDRLHDAETRSGLLSPTESGSLWRLLDVAEVLREAFAYLVPSLPILAEYDVVAAKRKPGNADALQRALDLNAMILLLHQRTRVMVPDGLWDRHCQLGKLVRDFQCQDHEVADAANLALTHTCREAFVLPILLALADPSTLSGSEFSMTLVAAQLWSGKVAFRIDLASSITLTARQESKPGPAVFLGEHRVRFDTKGLLRHMDRAMQALDDGRMPKEWAKESQGNIAASKALLKILKKRWGVVEPESINYPVHPWNKPGRSTVLAVTGFQLDSRAEQRHLADTDPRGLVRPTYDYQRVREDRLTLSPHEQDQARLQKLLEDAEAWNLAGEAVDSLLCARRQHKPSLYLRQLVGIQYGGKADWAAYRLGWIQGLQQGINDDHNGQLRPSQTQMLRIHLFAGQARLLRVTFDQEEAISAYLLLPDQMSSSTEPGHLQQQIRTASAGFSLILPVTSFRPERALRLTMAGNIIELQLDELLARGLDFDRVSFKPRADPSPTE